MLYAHHLHHRLHHHHHLLHSSYHRRQKKEIEAKHALFSKREDHLHQTIEDMVSCHHHHHQHHRHRHRHHHHHVHVHPVAFIERGMKSKQRKHFCEVEQHFTRAIEDTTTSHVFNYSSEVLLHFAFAWIEILCRQTMGSLSPSPSYASSPSPSPSLSPPPSYLQKKEIEAKNALLREKEEHFRRIIETMVSGHRHLFVHPQLHLKCMSKPVP